MLKKYEELVRVGFSVVTGIIIGFTLVGCSVESEKMKEESNISEEFIESLENVTEAVILDDDGTELLLDLDDEYVYVPSFTEDEANDFISSYNDLYYAHIEVYNPETYDIAYYTLTKEQVEKVKSMLDTATVDINQDSSLADFTTTLHMFNENEDYLYVIAMQSDKKTLFVEPGGLICDNLADYMDVLSVNAELPKE